MTYILGALCFAAVIASATMLILSINMRRINSRFWGIFLCSSLVCSLAFYGVHNSVLNKKEPPVIDFSGIVPQIQEEPEEEPVSEEIYTENPETPKETDDSAESTEPAQPEDKGETAPVVPSDNYNQESVQEEIPEEEPSPDELTEPESSAENEPQPEPPAEEEFPSAPPEIEYEGPFRTE